MKETSYAASNFAATLCRHIFRKHLGVIPATNLTSGDVWQLFGLSEATGKALRWRCRE